MSGAETFDLTVVSLDDQSVEFTVGALTFREHDGLKSWSVTIYDPTPTCDDRLGRQCWLTAEARDGRVLEGCGLIESRSRPSGAVSIRGTTPLLADGQER